MLKQACAKLNVLLFSWKQHGFFHRSDSMTKKGREKPQKPRNQFESSGENGSSGPVRQVRHAAYFDSYSYILLSLGFLLSNCRR